MAYVSQELKKKLSPRIKKLAKDYGYKLSLAVNNHSTLVANITSGPANIRKNYSPGHENPVREVAPKVYENIYVNEYYIERDFSGSLRNFLVELKALMSIGNHDKSDYMIDYFDVGWYVRINLGKWDKPFTDTI